MLLGESNGIFSHNCFASRRVCSYKHGVVSLQPQNGLLLENIQLKWPLKKIRLYDCRQMNTQETNKQKNAFRVTGHLHGPHLESWVGNAFIEIITGWSYVNRDGPFIILLWVFFRLWFVIFFFLWGRRGWHSILKTEVERFQGWWCLLRSIVGAVS